MKCIKTSKENLYVDIRALKGIRAVFNWVSKVIHFCFGFAFICLTHWLLCRPKPALTIVALSSICDVIVFDQKRHHLHSNSAGGKALSDDAPIRVNGSIVLEILTKLLKNLSEKLLGEFASATHGSSVASISRLDGTFSKIPKLQASPVIGQQLQQKDKKRRKRKGKKKKNEKRKA